MPSTYKQEGEIQPGSNDFASDLEQAGIDVEAESYPTEKEKPGGGINQSPKKRRMFRWVVLLMVIGLVGAGYVYRERLLRLVSKDVAKSTQTAERKVLYWVDPMHPAYKSDKPGKAPDCGMDLVPVYDENVSAERSTSVSRKVRYWVDPMVPGYKSDKPGKSPFMDMDLVPVYEDGSSGETKEHAAAGDSAAVR